MDTASDELARRFLLDDVTAEERERVEERFMTDSEYFDAVCALESDLILSHLRHELPEEWRERFESAYLTSPARRRRIEDMKALVETLAAAAPSTRGRHWMALTWTAAAAAALVAITTGALFMLRGQPSVEAPVAESTRPNVAPVATFELRAGASRAPGAAYNAFRRPPGDTAVELTTVPDAPFGRGPLRGEVRAVGGPVLALPGRPVARRRGAGEEVAWTVPSALLPPGDYVLTIAEDGGGSGAPIARRFFSIVE